MGFRAMKELQEFTTRLFKTESKNQHSFLPEDEEDQPTIAKLDQLQTYVGQN